MRHHNESINHLLVSSRLVAIFVILASIAVTGCEQNPPPKITATQPQAETSRKSSAMPESNPSAPPPMNPAHEPPPANSSTQTPLPANTTAQPPSSEKPPEVEQKPVEPEKPKLPPYLSIIERVDNADKARVDATIDSNKLRLTTENVRRLRVTRRDLPIARDKSVFLRVDNFVLEWTPKSDAIELELGRNAGWSVVEPTRKP